MDQNILSSEKDQPKQQFRTIDAFKVLGSVILVVGFSLNIVLKNNSIRKIDLAKNNAKNYAEQLIANSVKTTHVKHLREIASESNKTQQSGLLGLDPWGKPYTYKTISNGYGEPIYMVVLSAGPNESLDTSLDDIVMEPRADTLVQFKGDDIGYFKSVR